MNDIALELLKKIQMDFDAAFDKSDVIKKLYAKIRDGTATYIDANEFAVEVGDILTRAYKRHISADVLPDGRMYYNIAERVIGTTMKGNYVLISSVASQIQEALNKAAKIGIKPVAPELNQDRIDGIVNKVSSAENYEDVEWVLDEPIKTFSQSIVDDSIRANAEFHAKAGMQPVIVRKIAGNCCEWCKAVAGTYKYPDEVPKDVYRRHQRCRCTVDYVPKNGKVQNVHSKQWKCEGESDKIETRKKVGLGQSFREKTANMDPAEYAKAVELWKKVEDVPGMSQGEKEHIYEEFDNNLTLEEKGSAIVSRPIGNYWYYAVNKGHNQYKIYEKRPIEPARDIVDEVLTEMFGENWKEMLGE